MLDRLRGIGRGTARLVRAEGESLLVRARRSAAWTMVIVLGGVMLVAGGGAVLVSVGALLSAEVGWVAAVAILGAAVLLLGAVIAGTGWALMHRAMRREAVPREIRSDAELARLELQGEHVAGADRAAAAAAPTHVPTPPGALPARATAADGGLAASGPDGWAEEAQRFVARHPTEVAGGALCVLALLGPMRTVRLVGRAAMVAGVVQKLGSLKQEQTRATTEIDMPGPRPGAVPGVATDAPRPGTTVEGMPGTRGRAAAAPSDDRREAPTSMPRPPQDRRSRPATAQPRTATVPQSS